MISGFLKSFFKSSLELKANELVIVEAQADFIINSSGWGVWEIGFQSDFLRQTELTIHSTDERPGLIETNVGPNGEDACKGDSGEAETSSVS